ncbi:MAG: exonuclease domain-containing protein [Thiolinea sp.]
MSKINRIVRFFGQRPQVQERLTRQILVALQTLLETDNVAVSIDAVHYCVKSRGVMMPIPDQYYSAGRLLPGKYPYPCRIPESLIAAVPVQLDRAATADFAEHLSSGFPERMVLFDCETTGRKAAYHRIIEVALLVIEQGKLVEQWHTPVQPHAHIPPEIQQLTGITPGLLSDAPDFADVAEVLQERLQDRVLVAHYARFDHGFSA